MTTPILSKLTGRSRGWLSMALSSLTLSSLLLSGCGFQLRGNIDIPESLKEVYVKASSETATVRATKTLLKANGVRFVDADLAAYQIVILKENHERRSATLTTSAKTKEYELRSSLTFRVLDRGEKVVLQPTTLQTEQFYRYDEDNVNAKNQEEALLRREMYNNLAQQLVRRYLGLASQAPGKNSTGAQR